MASHDRDIEGLIEGLLGTLGQAERDGVLSTSPAPSATGYPWEAGSRADRPLAGRFGWVRVAVPLAAAAAVAVLFVGPSLFQTRAVQDVARDGLAFVQPAAPEMVADAEAVTTASSKGECDFNGDGVVDGKDIQAFLDRMHDFNGDPLLQADRLQRCLLGS